jgi:hypothetical protein
MAGHGGEMSITHAYLVEKARRYLAKDHPIVMTEMPSYWNNESPDAIGFAGNNSTLIECKISRSDFLADKKKYFRRNPNYGMGKHRYFLAPKDLIKINELPENWGLLEIAGRGLAVIQKAQPISDYASDSEKCLLISAIRRIGRSTPTGIYCKAYYNEDYNDEKTVVTLTVNNNLPEEEGSNV